MTSPIPHLDTTGFTNRTIMSSGDVAIVTGNAPTFLTTLIADEQAYMGERLRKRYPDGFGKSQPPLACQGTNPPPVALTGTPTVGSNELVIAIDSPGALGAALFRWSTDGGITWQATGVATSASVPLAGTGITVLFPAGAYEADNAYAAPTPVPRGILRRLAKLCTPSMFRKRGVNAQDPQIDQVVKEEEAIRAELKEAADNETGLFDVPVNDASSSSAISDTSPLVYSEASPWVGQDIQADRARREDAYR